MTRHGEWWAWSVVFGVVGLLLMWFGDSEPAADLAQYISMFFGACAVVSQMVESRHLRAEARERLVVRMRAAAHRDDDAPGA